MRVGVDKGCGRVGGRDRDENIHAERTDQLVGEVAILDGDDRVEQSAP
jgi:hypothetical protein